jgi:hypothetical protein
MISILTFPVPLVSVQMYSWPHEGILPSASYLDTCMFYICYAVEANTKIKTLGIKQNPSKQKNKFYASLVS